LLGELEQFQEFVIAPPDPLPRTETVIDNERDSMLQAEAALNNKPDSTFCSADTLPASNAQSAVGATTS
jgi:hypothetical protein